MDKFKLSDLNTKAPIKLEYISPTIIFLFNIKEMPVINDINRDLPKSHLKAVSIYIGDESKKVHIWKQQQLDCMPIYHGGRDLKAYYSQGITELPWLLIIKNNEAIFSNRFTEIEKPTIKSLHRKFPEFKIQQNKTIKKINKIISNQTLTIDEKLVSLETISIQNNEEIKEIKQELDDKDVIIRSILNKVNILTGSRSRYKYNKGDKSEGRNNDISVISLGTFESRLGVVEEAEDDDIFPKGLWISSISTKKTKLPVVVNNSPQKEIQPRSKSTLLKSNNKNKYY